MRSNIPHISLWQELARSCGLRLLRNMVVLAAIFSMCAALGGCGFFAQKPAPEPPQALKKHRIVCSAWGQMGKRYRAGSASPQKGFDCSGLVWWSYKQNGVKVPRITKDQATAGRRISRKAALPGDIVVFKTSQSPRGLHTGIYAGDGKFIHSPSSGKSVCLESLSSSYWRDKLISIRRIAR